MKTLILLRHAKSDWDGELRDFDRPLNGKGMQAARTMGAHMQAIDLRWDHAVASPAARVVGTLDHAGQGYGARIEPEWDRRLYLAPAAMLLDVIHAAPVQADALLLSGHNPGLEELVVWLTMPGGVLRDAVELKFPTASLAVLTAEVDEWRAITPGGCTLATFVRPRDLDPTLGPDD